MRRLNGWRRLWVLATLIWGLAVVYAFGRDVISYIGITATLPHPDRAGWLLLCLVFAVVWLGPAIAVYALGAGVAWVRRGFNRT